MVRQGLDGVPRTRERVPRRGLFGRAAAAAGAASAISAALAPSMAFAQTAPPARLTGKLQVVQVVDWHPDHNTYVADVIKKFAAAQRWDLDHSDLVGFLGGSDVYQKLQAQKAANQPVDAIVHFLSARILAFFDLVRDATPVVNRVTQKWGVPNSSALAAHVVNGKWIGVPFYDRTGGYWLRGDKFAEAGYSVEDGSFEAWESVKEAALAVSRPDENFYGWGMTVNRSGDGNSLTWNIIWQWGGALADPTGEIVTLYSPETIDAMTWLAEIYTNPVYQRMLPPGVNAWTDISNNEAYNAGILGFTSNAGTLFATARANKNPVADVTALIQVPLGPYGVRLQNSAPAYVYFMNGSRNFDAASQLAEHLVSEEVQSGLYSRSSGYVVPPYEKLWDHPLITSDPISMGFKPVALNDPPFQGVAYRGPLSEAAEAVDNQAVSTDMIGEILAGKPVEQAVREAHFRAVQIFQAFGRKGR